MADETRHAYYVTTLDRIGLAILAGGALTGWLAMLLVLAGGQRSPVALGLAWAFGTVVAMLGIVAVAGPVWLFVHRHGRRGPGMAAATAALLTWALLITGQMWGTGGGGYRWASALAAALPFALAAAAIGAAMQRVAYRRLL